MTITRGHGKEIDDMIEQAFRRGYMQGFNNGIKLPASKYAIGKARVHAWRYGRDRSMIAPPGSGCGEEI